MGGKKKGGKGKGGEKKKAAADEPPDESTDKVIRLTKKGFDALNQRMPARLASRFAEITNDKSGDLNELIIWEPMGVLATRAITDALCTTAYAHLK